MNISMVHSKGGVTKSSIAANLSIWLRQKGHHVAAVDLDAGRFGNKSLSTAVGQADPELPVFHAESAQSVRTLLAGLSEKFHFIISDAPGGFQTTAETNLELLKHTDFALVPVKPDFDDIEPLTVVEEVITEAKAVNPLLEARVIINCLDLRTKTARHLDKTIAIINSVAPSLRVMRQAVRIDRNAFQSARMNGSVVIQGPRSAARDDLDSLFSGLLSDIVVAINRHGLATSGRTTTNGGNDEAKAVHG
jgi:cellulose biosynthesis protein BcsQ